MNLAVEEENLAAIPFAVLERRVGKRIGKIEIKGTKKLPDGTELDVLWQIQGNNELGLPTEQDLDIFIALGVMTFRSNFSKTVSFSGREIAKILNIGAVHGKFYQRLKLAMDRFIPLRFRSLTSSDHQEEVKWLNVFQEASFSLDRNTGRCTGSVTWTDKLIQSMDSGFFRLVDAGRYMELDGITAKHMYRFLTVAFEKTDLVVVDARKLATEHLGILKLPAYMSRLMQTLEPAFDQLRRIQVVGSYHVISNKEWRVALHRHASYVPERKNLLLSNRMDSVEHMQLWCQQALEKAGFTAKTAGGYCERFSSRPEMYQLQRAARLVEEMKQEEVLQHVALSLVRRAMEAQRAPSAPPNGPETRGLPERTAAPFCACSLEVDGPLQTGLLDWCEIAIEVCRYKKNTGQVLKNLPGLLIKIARDPEAQKRLVSNEVAESYLQRFREREASAMRMAEEEEERRLLIEYEDYRRRLAQQLLQGMPENERDNLRKVKTESLKLQDRLDRIPVEERKRELDQLIMQDLAQNEAPSFDRWRLRLRAQQAVFPFHSMPAGVAS